MGPTINHKSSLTRRVQISSKTKERNQNKNITLRPRKILGNYGHHAGLVSDPKTNIPWKAMHCDQVHSPCSSCLALWVRVGAIRYPEVSTGPPGNHTDAQDIELHRPLLKAQGKRSKGCELFCVVARLCFYFDSFPLSCSILRVFTFALWMIPEAALG
jgi:hypothetical protein